MALKNQWVGYLDRSYKNIKSSILDRMRILVPEMSDHSESNLFVIIVSLFAGLVEQLNYYVDNIARESYISTARRYSSLIKLTRLFDYRVMSKVAARVDLKITATGVGGDPLNLTNNYTFQEGLIITGTLGTQFITDRKATIFKNTSSVTVGARQCIKITNLNLGITTTQERQSFRLPVNYEHDTLQITISGSNWDLKKTLAFSGPFDQHFIVEVNENKEAFVIFGDGINGYIPPTTQPVLGTFYETKGKAGCLEANTINTWVAEPTLPAGVNSFKVTNLLAAAGGVDIEDIERIRRHAPLSIRTLDRAVTYQDYQDIAELVPGVGKAKVKLDVVNKSIIIYIAPDEGGIAAGSLLTKVTEEFLLKGMVGPSVITKAAGETILRISLDVTAKLRRDVLETASDVKAAIIEGFGFNNSSINKKIRYSDIIALVDNLPSVDYLTLTELTTKPYPRKLNGDTPLESFWHITINPKNTEVIKWRILVLSGNTTAYLYKTLGNTESQDPNIITIHNTDPTYTDFISEGGEISLSIWGSFATGNSWVFYSYPHNKDIELIDFTIPTIDIQELNITVHEQLTSTQ